MPELQHRLDDDLRAALVEADTIAWHWDLDTDELRNLDQSLRPLGHDLATVGRTQAAWDQLIHPDDQGPLEAAWQRHARGECDPYESTYRVRDARGQWRWLFERGRIVRRHDDGRPWQAVGTCTDITERVRAQHAAREADARLEQIALHVPGVLYQFVLKPDGRGRFPYMSPRSLELMGVDPAAAMSDSADGLETVHRDDRAALLEGIAESARTLEPWHHEFRVRRPDGAVRWIVGRSTPRRLDDGSVTWYGYLEDVTDRHERDEARRAAELAQAASQAKSEFLSRVSHELRTPLNAMLGFAQLLEIDTEDPASDGQRRRLQHIREAGAHLVAMLGELLDLTRVESGHLALQLEAVPLHELAVETLTMVQPDADRAQVRLSLQMAGEVAARADRLRLRQVLLNLLGNAIKYNRPGGRVELRVEAPADGRVRVQVCDDGVGIAEADLPRLFEPFHRGRHAGGPISGTGIGLSLSQRLAQAMGGTLDASVAPGQDTVFNLWLPRA